MEFILLLLVAAIAVLMFVPEIIRNYELDSPIDTISSFHRQMGALATSTNHNYRGHYYYSPPEEHDPEPYIRRGQFDSDRSVVEEDFVPYPSNKNRGIMEARRNQVTALLLLFALGTGITIAVPSLRWIIPLHISALLLLSGYVFLSMFLPLIARRIR